MSNNYSEWYTTLTYRNPLIYFKCENFRNWKHRSLVLRKDPLVKTYITRLDEEIFQEIPTFEPELPEQIIQEWQDENWSDHLIRMFDLARVHRWCIITLYDDAPYVRVFGPREVLSMVYENEQPISADVQWWKRLPKNQAYSMKSDILEFGEGSPSLFVTFGKPSGDWIAESDLEDKWSLITELRYIKEDIVRNSAKSSGFYFVKMGSMANEDDESAMEDTLAKASYGNAIAAKETKIQEIIDVHPKNAKFSIEAFTKLMKELSGACRVPLSFFNGETEKGGIGKEDKSQDEIMINKKKRSIFGNFKSYLLKLVEMRWGFQATDVYPTLEESKDEQYEEQIMEGGQDGSEDQIEDQEN